MAYRIVFNSVHEFEILFILLSNPILCWWCDGTWVACC